MQSRASLTLVVIAACSTSDVGDVAITGVTPASGTSAAPVEIELTGSYALDLTNDLDDGTFGVSTVDARISDTPLENVTRIDATRITATVPAGLAAGLHDIEVSIGARRGVLADAYAVTGSSLDASLAVPAELVVGESATVTMTVTNTGISAATAVEPSELTLGGTVAATLTASPAAGASLAAGASMTFEWTYSFPAIGTVAFTGHASGVDEATGLPLMSAPATSNTADVAELVTVFGDVFGDTTHFGYVVGYQGRVYIGPNRTGDALARLLPDGTGAELVAMTFARDVSGNQSGNAFAGTYTSIGYTACTLDTAQCGPDNETGRGLLWSGTIGGAEWLVIGGAKANNAVEYVYMTTDADATLDFRYVDLSAYLGANTNGFSAAHVFGDRLYMGFPDTGGARPYFVALQQTPPAPGLDATGTLAIDLEGDAFPGFNTPNPSRIDAITDFGGLVYLGNQAGLFASRSAAPGPYSTIDWAPATPTATAWTSKVSRSTAKVVDLLPADRAISQMAVFGGRLYVGRNTTSGPQLWACDPALGAAADRCEPGDWVLVAPNTTGDTQLSQLNDTDLSSISMVTATATHLYVGFDALDGARVFRTSNLAPSAAADFVELGRAGFGDLSDTRILDGKALTFPSGAAVWVTVGDGVSSLRLVRLRD